MIARRFVSCLFAVIMVSIGAMQAHAQNDETFMPKGGKTLLLELFPASDIAELRSAVGQKRTEAEWAEAVAGRARTLSERERAELVAYLSYNLPLPAGTADTSSTREAIATTLPADGRELAWTQCQFCHSLYTGYLMHQRDVQGWRNLFVSPFHRRMKMTEAERETFSRYSAINMPMKPEDVPKELRF
jgi:hypothetical protein